jgi:5'-nucleotidase
MHILISNDDGVYSDGIACLAQAMSSLGQIWVVAPERARNAVGRALTLHRPLRVTQITDHTFAVDGTPSDCINIAINSLLPERPCLVVSGINRGANLADDIAYSGTVAAAFEATIFGIPAIAVSLACQKNCNFEPAARFTAKVAGAILEGGLPHGILLNINIPDTHGDDVAQYQITCQGRSIYESAVEKRVDPRGGIYYWIGGDGTRYENIPGSDADAVVHNCASITPVSTNLTHYAAFDFLRNLRIQETLVKTKAPLS